jgi:hypothetical protein
MYICVGQKAHNIIVRKKGSQYYIYYLFLYRENKIRKKRRETWKRITDTSNAGKNRTQTKTNVKKTE